MKIGLFNFMIFDLKSIIKNTLFKMRCRFNFYYPNSFQIATTEQCNLRCIFCKRTAIERDEGKVTDENMSFEKFKFIIDSLPSAKKIDITGLGEGLLNKDFFEIIKYAKEKNIDVIFSDNFFFIDEKTSEKIINSGINTINPSIDGATKETYEKIRIGSNFERVIENVKNFIEIKKDKGVKFPIIHFCYVVNKHNVEEINKFIEMVASFGGDENIEIEIRRMVAYSEEMKNLQIKVPEKIINEANKRAKELNIKLNWFNIPSVKNSVKNCDHWLMPFISITGDVFPCCSELVPDQANGFGNLFNQNFEEIWNSKKYNNFRKTLLRGAVPSHCDNCNFCKKNA